MAKNLRAKVPAEDTLFVHDVNTATTKKFLEENPTGVRVANNVREIAEKAVCSASSLTTPCMMIPFFSKLYDLSWGHLWLFP